MTWRDHLVFWVGIAMIAQAMARGSSWGEASIGAALIGAPGAAKLVGIGAPRLSVKAEVSADVVSEG